MATIIKSATHLQSSGVDLRGVAYNLVDMRERADECLEQVRQEAASIVREAREEAESIRKAAEQRGQQAARDAAEKVLDQKVAKRMKSLNPALQSAVRQIEDAKQSWLQHWEDAAVDLATQIAERIVRSELSQRPELTVEWIREALQLAAGSGEMTLRLNPADEQTLRTQVENLTAIFAPIGPVRVVADDEVAPCGCRVESKFGVVDQQLVTQLNRVKQELA